MLYYFRYFGIGFLRKLRLFLRVQRLIIRIFVTRVPLKRAIDNYPVVKKGVVKKKGFVSTDRKPTDGEKNADFLRIKRSGVRIPFGIPIKTPA